MNYLYLSHPCGEGGRVEEFGREKKDPRAKIQISAEVYFSLDKLSIFPNLIEVLFRPIYQRQSTFGLMVFVAGCSHFYRILCKGR